MSYKKRSLEIGTFYVEGIRQGLQAPINQEVASNCHAYIDEAFEKPHKFVASADGQFKHNP